MTGGELAVLERLTHGHLCVSRRTRAVHGECWFGVYGVCACGEGGGARRRRAAVRRAWISTCVSGGILRLCDVLCTNRRRPSAMSLGPLFSSQSLGQPRASQQSSWPIVNVSLAMSCSSLRGCVGRARATCALAAFRAVV